MMTPINHLENLRRIFGELRQEIESLETDLLYWAESGVEADYALTREPDDPDPEPEPEPAKTKAKAKPKAKKEPEVTLEQVRGVLADLARADLSDQVRELIVEAGAEKLSEVDPGKYSWLLERAKELSDGTE